MEKYRTVDDLTDDEFLDKYDKLVFLEYLKDDCAVLMEMANVVGNKVTLEKQLPFSFHFCDKEAVHQQHGIRLKVLWNPSKAPSQADGYMKMHGDYEYVIGSKKYKPTEKEISILRDFCKKYKVLFAAVWEDKLIADDVADYLKGRILWKDLMYCFYNISASMKDLLIHCQNLKDLEYAVRRNKIFNMHD